MKKIFLSLLFVLSSTLFAVQAETVESHTEENQVFFRVSSFLPFGGRVYYNCDTVRFEAINMLNKLGATNIDVTCTGGIDPFSRFARDAYVDATFNTVVEGEVETVELRDFRGCHLATELFKGFQDQFDILEVQGLRSCMRSSDSYRIRVTLTK